MMQLTDKQRQAVFTNDCDILVSAAAGSGKTAVLSERILQKLLNEERPVSVTEFLIVTFTNAAAAEMKERIGKKILEASADESLDENIKKHLRKQLSLLSKASITTIHAFCLEVVKNNFHILGIDPAVRVADPNETELIKFQAANEMLEEMYALDGQMFSDVCKWLGGGNDERLADKILAVYQFLNGFAYPFDWLDEKVEEYNPENNTDILKNKWVNELFQIGKNKLLSVIPTIEHLLNEATSAGIFTYEEAFLKDIVAVKEYLKCFDDGIDAVLGKTVVFDNIRPGKFGFDKDTVKVLSGGRDKYKKKVTAISKTFAFSRQSLSEQFEKVYPRLKCLQESLVVFDRIFKDKKKKACIIDFSDFEHLALKVLSETENGVAEALRNKYAEIMIDEYQDCNQTQELIFSYINRKIDGKSSNMFMVGDIKQSIYRFRLADPDIFADKNRNYLSEGIQRKIVLNNNFRSSATILDGVNAVFEKIMTSSVGGVDYSDEEKLFFRSNEVDKSKDSKCELVSIEKGEDSDLGEADYVAERILDLVEKGYKFSDISILIRQRSKSREMENALKSRNIPYFSDCGGGYFESLEISMLTSLLKVIDNPVQDIELAAVLRSPVFGFDETLLAEIRLEDSGPFYGALLKFASKGGEKSKKCQDFLNRLSIWRDKAVFTPVDEFIEYIIADTGLDVFASSLTGGEQRTANLKLFVLKARLLQNSGFKGLFSFVGYIDRISAGKDSGEAKMLSENSNVVRILTVHKSKGLEFPVVFLYGCETEFNKRDTASQLILHKTAGIGIKFTDTLRKIKYPLVSFDPVKNAISRDNLSEEMRVLYVALTRAKERLICTSIHKDPAAEIEKTDLTRPSEINSYFGWIAKARNDENWELKIIHAEEINKSVYDLDEIDITLPESDDFSTVKDIFEFEYPYKKSINLPTKLSVSEVKKRREYESPFETRLFIPEIAPLPSFMSEEIISATDKGIINHLIFKHIDINNPDVDYCISNLIQKGLISDDEAKVVDKVAISAFFKSDIGLRIKKADKVYRELAFEFDVQADTLFPNMGYVDERVLLQGIIDMMFTEGGETILIDFKTDRILTDETREKYKTQLELYSLATERVTGSKVTKKYLYLLSKREFVEI